MKNCFWSVAAITTDLLPFMETELLAKQKASDLAKKHPGTKFVVMKSVCDVQVDGLMWNEHSPWKEEDSRNNI